MVSISLGNGWAANTVNTAIFRQHGILTREQFQFTAFYIDDQILRVVCRNLSTNKVTSQDILGNFGIGDAHNCISLGCDSEGFLHLAYDHHRSRLRYRRSVRPLDVCAWSDEMPMTGEYETRLTYPTFISNPADGCLLFLFREGNSTKGALRLKRWSTLERRWRDLPEAVLSGAHKSPWTSNPYWNRPAVGKDGMIHLSFAWRVAAIDTGGRINNINIDYARSPDNGTSWYSTRSGRFSLPITQVNSETVWPVSPGANLMNQCSMAVDSAGDPHIVFYSDDSRGIPQYQHLHLKDGVWRHSFLTARTEPFSLSGPGTLRVAISRPEILIDRHDRVYVIYRGDFTGDRLAVQRLLPPTYLPVMADIRLLSEDAVGFAEPVVDHFRWERDGILSLLIQYNDQPENERVLIEPMSRPISIVDWKLSALWPEDAAIAAPVISQIGRHSTSAWLQEEIARSRKWHEEVENLTVRLSKTEAQNAELVAITKLAQIEATETAAKLEQRTEENKLLAIRLAVRERNERNAAAARESSVQELAAKLRREEERVAELAAKTTALNQELAHFRKSAVGRIVAFFRRLRNALRSVERNVRLKLKGRKGGVPLSKSKRYTDENAARLQARQSLLDGDFLREQSPAAARQVFNEIVSQLLEGWREENARAESEYETLRSTISKRRPRVMIGTLCSGEPEFEACVQSIRRQSYRNFEHVVISNLPKKRAMDALYQKFLGSDFDILIKIDADMVVLDERFVERVVNVLRWNPKVALLQMAITDFYSGCEMQGVNAYTKQMAWNSAAQDPLFTDKTNTRSDMRLVVWSTFQRSVIHSPNPNEFYAFHFGVHRALKVRYSAGAVEEWERAREQMMYLERTFEHYKLRRSRNLLLASLGGELALHGSFDVASLDYGNSQLRGESEKLGYLSIHELERKLDELRSRPAKDPDVERFRARRSEIALRPQVGRLLLLVPHFELYGGVYRFFEIARAARRQGVEAVVAAAGSTAIGESSDRLPHDFPDVETMFLNQALSEKWDAVVCGDYSSGLMCLLPWVQASLSAVYLLNGWLHRPINLQQIQLASPDVVLANSSYAAEHFPECAPAVVAGGVDFDIFYPTEKRVPRTGEPFRIFTAAGRLKERKRFFDVVEACLELRRRGISVELHILNATKLEAQLDVSHVVHVGLLRGEVAELLRSMDFAIFPEMDAGWNNPAAEAMACGVPLVCTRAGSTDFAFDGKTALVVEPQRPDQIADAVERLANDAALATRLSEEGLRVIAQYSWFNLTRKLIDTLEDCRPQAQSKEGRNVQARARIVKNLMQ